MVWTELDETVSVAVLTYNPDRGKLFKTIKSIIEQKNIRVQIVVSDDGSEENYFHDLQTLFAETNFENYCLVENTQNQGTVKNCLAAVSACTGAYVKLISPGDYFATVVGLSEWLSFLNEKGKDWSFCDASYYRIGVGGKIDIMKAFAHPQNIGPYCGQSSASKDGKTRWNYVVLRDICLGAATLCKRDVLDKYLREIAEAEIIYTEDTIYRLMMFDGLQACYFSSPVIMYECGAGISTSGNDIWRQRIKADWDKTTGMLLKRCGDCKADRKYRWAISVMDGSNKRKWERLRKLLIPGYVEHKMRVLFFNRKSR